MTRKPFSINIGRPRWRNLLFARALLFAITLVLSSSGEDIEPFATQENASAPRRLGRSSGPAIEPLLQLQTERELRSKSAKSKSAKVGSKSSSKGSKSKASKSKSSKSKSSKGKSSKGESAKSKSSKSKSAKSKSAKSNAETSKSENEESAHSVYDHESEGYSGETHLDDMNLDAEAEDAPVPLPEGIEESGAVQPLEVLGDPNARSASKSSFDDSSTEEMEDTESTGSEATATLSDGGSEPGDVDVASIENEGNEEAVEPENLKGDFMEESNKEGIDCEGDADAQSSCGEGEMEDTSNARVEETKISSDTAEHGNEDEDTLDAPNLEDGFIEQRSEESEVIEDLDMEEEALNERESLE